VSLAFRFSGNMKLILLHLTTRVLLVKSEVWSYYISLLSPLLSPESCPQHTFLLSGGNPSLEQNRGRYLQFHKNRSNLPNAFTGHNVKYCFHSHYTAWNSSGANFHNQESKSFVRYGHKIHDKHLHTSNFKIVFQKKLLWSERWIIINSQSSLFTRKPP
jgi:hypothetical protein